MEFIRRPVSPVYAGQEVAFHFELESGETDGDHDFQVIDTNAPAIPVGKNVHWSYTQFMQTGRSFEPRVAFPNPGQYEVQVRSNIKGATPSKWGAVDTFSVEPAGSAPAIRVDLQTGSKPDSSHEVLWKFVRGVTEKLTFTEFNKFANDKSVGVRPYSPYGSLTYDALHDLATSFVTETALGKEYAVRKTGRRSKRGKTTWSDATGTAAAVSQSYVKGQIPPGRVAFPLSVSRQYPRNVVPFVELIYVYWLEEGMLFQSLNRILARFQNRRAPGGRDPLSRLAVSPLLPLRGLLWGLAEAEKDRLSLRRRAAEYEYQYGLQLIGRAVPPSELLVERRTQFLEAFHSLLNACYHFYREDSDKTVEADAFPLLSHLRELHLVLAHGANNQFTDVSLAARIETLDVQWMLAQQEMQEFLGGRTMVPYDEIWMARVDTMKSIQGWSDASITHFYDLAYHGEQLLLSVRHGQWNSVTGTDEDDAKNWAKNWKQSVQRYIHAYRAVAGVDLSERVDTTMPSTLLQRRLAQKLVRY